MYFRSSLLILLLKFKLFILECHNSGVSLIILEICRRNIYFSDYTSGGRTVVILSVKESRDAKYYCSAYKSTQQ